MVLRNKDRIITKSLIAAFFRTDFAMDFAIKKGRCLFSTFLYDKASYRSKKSSSTLSLQGGQQFIHISVMIDRKPTISSRVDSGSPPIPSQRPILSHCDELQNPRMLLPSSSIFLQRCRLFNFLKPMLLNQQYLDGLKLLPHEVYELVVASELHCPLEGKSNIIFKPKAFSYRLHDPSSSNTQKNNLFTTNR